ncbi:hypothetical protein [Nostocoides sp. HKS02]|uniref:hypothetical protein n=1 Tax=Nostocoides sp. HKS02 TaxID=1813880 RepID=UPI001E3AFA23|nr:hypothetical protein [Tetrasphaera sp. HKS02]
MSTISSERLAVTFVQVADTLVDDFDLIDFLTLLTERAAELAGSSASGLLLSDEHGHLQFMAASQESARILELVPGPARGRSVPGLLPGGSPGVTPRPGAGR